MPITLNGFRLGFLRGFAGVQKLLGISIGIVFFQNLFQKRYGFLAFQEFGINVSHDELKVNFIRELEEILLIILFPI